MYYLYNIFGGFLHEIFVSSSLFIYLYHYGLIQILSEVSYIYIWFTSVLCNLILKLTLQLHLLPTKTDLFSNCFTHIHYFYIGKPLAEIFFLEYSSQKIYSFILQDCH